ncbi:Oxoglutarate dehydrogenase (succinyl-transferring) [Ascochyta lentis]
MHRSKRITTNRVILKSGVIFVSQLARRSCYLFHTPTRTFATRSVNVGTILHAPPDPIDNFLHGGSTRYLDATYHQWRKDPKSVHASWQIYFESIDDTSFPATYAYHPPPGLVSGAQRRGNLTANIDGFKPLQKKLYVSKAREIIRTFREHGHTKANTNPLEYVAEVKNQHDVVLPDSSGLGSQRLSGLDLDLEFDIDGEPHALEELGNSSTSLRKVITACQSIYCSSIGVELCHITDPIKQAWLCTKVRDIGLRKSTIAEKKIIVDDLARGTMLERFLAMKFPNEKHFGLDGLEAMVPGLCALIDRSANEHGVRQIILSQCHRGRLNIFSSVFQKSPDWLFRQFSGTVKVDVENGRSSDVKYHYGIEGERMTTEGNTVKIDVVPNPSHLEATGPAAQGKTKAAQDLIGGDGQSRIMPIAMHTDGAISGQGSVYEVLNLSKLKGYEVGGTIRITVNNQVSFTTDPASARSTEYCTDIAKYIGMPIFHVNSDDPEAVLSVFKLASDWRARFQSDIMIDFVCYRRFGHNEIDQASFTQPEMYKTIADKTPVLEVYAEKLNAEGMVDAEFVESCKQRHWDRLEDILKQSQHSTGSFDKPPSSSKTAVSTASTVVDNGTLANVMEHITTVPEQFTPHRTLLRILRGRKKDFETGTVDWVTAEALAFGSLLKEGHAVRLSGEDVERGTFLQRHSVFHDQNTYEKWTALKNINNDQASFTVYNSPLSEFGVLGFDYGYSLRAPDSLTMWEAQFGDFINNAQVIFDQFVASGEAKWDLQSNLVLSLPHGYDRQGPEHSSARLGRFLELCNEGLIVGVEQTLQQRSCNMRVAYPTTPANLFHALRRQVLSPIKKPLILFFSKSLLRHPLARSRVSELTGSTAFQPVLNDPKYTATLNIKITKLIFCSGQVFTALHEYRNEHSIMDVAIVRIEELHPFPSKRVQDVLDQFPAAKDVVWCQEEPYNGGAWYYVKDRLESVFNSRVDQGARELRYTGRRSAAAVATGSKRLT